MSSIDVLDLRNRLQDNELCANSKAEVAAVLIDDLFDQALVRYATADSLDRLIEQWRVERAEMLAEQAQFLADIRHEINEFHKENSARERERDERERQRDERERERDERERERDERERQRARDQEARDARMRTWVLAVVGLGFAAVSVVNGLIVAFG